MALSPDEMNRRKERREAQRKKQRRALLKVRLGMAAVLLVLIGATVGIYRLIENAPVPPSGEEDGISMEETVPEPTRRNKKDPITTIHIRAAGDLNITNSVVQAGVDVGGYDFTRAFQDVSATLAEADLTVLNLEGNIAGEPYGTETTSAPIHLLEALRNSGVDLVQMANSCAINNGLIGLNNTLNALRTAGLEPVGAFSNPAEFRKTKGYTICQIQGIKVAFVAFTKGVGGMGMPAGNEDCVNLLYLDYDETYRKVDTQGISAVLDAVAQEKPDLTIALLHWGSENNDIVSTTQKSIVTLMQKKGVSVIIGTHPHLVQEIDYDAQTGKLIAYSLGDFFGDASRGGTNYSIILDLEITKDTDQGTTRVTGYSYIPIYTLTESQSGDGFRRVVRIEQAMKAYDDNFVDRISRAAYSDMEYSLTRIASRTSGKG